LFLLLFWFYDYIDLSVFLMTIIFFLHFIIFFLDHVTFFFLSFVVTVIYCCIYLYICIRLYYCIVIYPRFICNLVGCDSVCKFIFLYIQFFLLFFFRDVFFPGFTWEFLFECSLTDLFSLGIILIHFWVFVSNDGLFVFISEFCTCLSF